MKTILSKPVQRFLRWVFGGLLFTLLLGMGVLNPQQAEAFVRPSTVGVEIQQTANDTGSNGHEIQQFTAFQAKTATSPSVRASIKKDCPARIENSDGWWSLVEIRIAPNGSETCVYELVVDKSPKTPPFAGASMTK